MYQGCSFMAADITQVIRTGTTNRKCFGIFELLNIYFVVSGIAIIFYPESNRIQQFIIINQFNISDRMNLFSPANHFISSIGIYILNKMR